jgi:hypothetical protein
MNRRWRARPRRDWLAGCGNTDDGKSAEGIRQTLAEQFYSLARSAEANCMEV